MGGTDGSDLLEGTSGGDVIAGFGGHDTVMELSGDKAQVKRELRHHVERLAG